VLVFDFLAFVEDLLEGCSALGSISDEEARSKVSVNRVAAAGVDDATGVVVEDVEDGATLLLTTGRGLGFVFVVVAGVSVGATVFGVFDLGSFFGGCGVGDLDERAELEEESGSESIVSTVSTCSTSDIRSTT
jgi:hypothetical protein